MDTPAVRPGIEPSAVRSPRVRRRAQRPARSTRAVPRRSLGARQQATQLPSDARAPGWYRRTVDIAFAFFSSTRLLTYVPTMFMIYTSADSSQYSMLTWLAWVCSNASMGLWLFENNGRRLNQAVVVSIGNALMCLATWALIAAYRV